MRQTHIGRFVHDWLIQGRLVPCTMFDLTFAGVIRDSCMTLETVNGLNDSVATTSISANEYIREPSSWRTIGLITRV